MSKQTKIGAVEELIDACIKKKGFKQLASYSIKCLYGLLLSSRIGWEIQAKTAFDGGGLKAVLDVLIKYAGDAEIMKMGLSACRSMVSVSTEDSFDLTETVKLSIALLHRYLCR